ncbi:LysM peptidoglycan-binding domain-containing protein [Okeania sp. SIO2B3]|uniref:LysM peptidoglycan-binding domain-containing protein n=1 Tax=Okeania sp. SIO2B3 TaxID=2607784 RepID=UPI0013C1317C|nr:LysM peptidoglycan-binding domain-containing protein [Okeania sp. SIO2B3]NET42916.1 LysM peptidoglycan-binding domain-containing protein [Okeania sp. SIO2B3]
MSNFEPQEFLEQAIAGFGNKETETLGINNIPSNDVTSEIIIPTFGAEGDNEIILPPADNGIIGEVLGVDNSTASTVDSLTGESVESDAIRQASSVDDLIHTVQEGDNLWDIATRFTGNGSNYLEIANYNGISNPGLIFPNDPIRIPQHLIPQDEATVTTGGVTTGNSNDFIYTVEYGDNLWDIATRFTGNGSNYSVIANHNSISDPSQIDPYDTIRIPQHLISQDNSTVVTGGGTTTGGTTGGSTTQTSVVETIDSNLGLLSGSRSFSGFVGNSDTSDRYDFYLDSTSNFNLVLNGLSENIDVRLFDSNNSIESSTNSFNSDEFINTTLSPGNYYIEIYPYNGANSNYNLSLSASSSSDTSNSNDLGDPFVVSLGDIWNHGQYSGGVQLNAYAEFDPNKETMLIIHGWNNSPDDMEELLKTAISKDYQVLALDWEEPARWNNNLPTPSYLLTGTITSALTNFQSGSIPVDFGAPFHTAGAIAPVARQAANWLHEAGMNPEQLKIVGHSLGSYVGAEIGRIFKQNNWGEVKEFVALDPAWPGNTYDIDGEALGWGQRVPNFRDIAQDSLALVTVDATVDRFNLPLTVVSSLWEGDLAGDNEQAKTADRSFLIDFTGDTPIRNNIDNHGAVVKVYADWIKNNVDGELPSDLQYDWYGNDGNTLWTIDSRAAHEGVIHADLSGEMDRITYINGVNWGFSQENTISLA